MIKKNFTFIFLVLHGYEIAALEFQKCSINNSTCQQAFYQAVATTYAANGIKEIGVPPLDPFHIKNITVSVMDFVKLKLVEGYCFGINTCKLLKYKTNMTNFRKVAEIKCARIVIQGSYTISTPPKFCQILGKVTGCGNVSVVLEDWYFKFDYPFALIRHADGNIYIKAYFEQGKYVSEVLRHAIITADNIMVNDRDATSSILEFMNKNSKIVLKTFGKSFHEISVRIYYDINAKFFDNVPAMKYMSDDPAYLQSKMTTCNTNSC